MDKYRKQFLQEKIDEADTNGFTDGYNSRTHEIQELEAKNKKLSEALEKMCEWHEKQATWDKGDNGYYAAKALLKEQ